MYIMPDWLNSIDEKKVFIDLFDIYEQELLAIFQYVAPINNTCHIVDSEWKECGCWCKINLNVSWNKIHELHLRVCAESENLMKRIAKKLFPKRDFDQEYRKEKSKDIKSVTKKLQVDDAERIKEKLYKYADMQFYLGVLDKELWLCSKIIQFSKIVETNPEKQISLIQPFERNNKDHSLPTWWDNYNIIKHYKIENYTQCTLRDLINSLWAYYMLLNYLSMNINNPVYDDIEIKSKIFKPTIWRVIYPLNISLYYGQYRENKPWFIKDVYRGDKRIIPWYYDDKLKDEIQLELDKAHNEFILQDRIFEVNNEYLKNENYFFYYSYKQQGVIVQNYINNQAIQQPLWTLKMEKRFNVPKIDD